MNLLRTQYISPQSQYVYLTNYLSTNNNMTIDVDDETNQTSSEQTQ